MDATSDVDWLSFDADFWSQAVYAKTSDFLEATRSTDPSLYSLLKANLSDFLAVRRVLRASVMSDECTRDEDRKHTIWRPRVRA